MQIEYGDRIEISDELLKILKRAADVCAETEELDPEGLILDLSFALPEEIREMNRDFRGIDRVTDVLSFPQFEDAEEIRDAQERFGEAEIGDVVICVDQAKKQAADFGHSSEREIIYLFVHSVLHLMGYDHMEEDERALMRGREEQVLAILGVDRGFTMADHATLADYEAEGLHPRVASSSKVEPVVPDPDMMIRLYREASAAMENSYSPYSRFAVGAALLAADDQGQPQRIFRGCNVENASYGAAICAERTACVKAVSEGFRKFSALAVVSSEGRASMCGICRQFLAEFAPDLLVITGEDENHLETYRLSQLLPDSFQLENK